jgi:multidrug efflux system membrane fusion protein
VSAAGLWFVGKRGGLGLGLGGRATPASTATAAIIPAEAAIPVIDAEARYADVAVKLEAVGTVQALNSVVIRSQVDGRLLQLAVKEGANVRRGEVVARIDASVYQATHQQTMAKKMQDEATLANAKVDLERYTTLSERGFGPRQQTDTQRALVAQLTALVQADQAAIDNAKAILDFTTIRSPIDGRAGIRLIDEGNLVRAADAVGIVGIAQIQPISVTFNLPQQQFRQMKEAMSRGDVRVLAIDTDGATTLAEGTVDVIDNQIDPATGTLKIRAKFANDDLALWPGQFVSVRAFTDVLRNVVSISSAAVQRGPDGPFVYRVSDDSKAVLTPVVIARQDSEAAVVSSGITPPDRVIISGFQRLADQARVRVNSPHTSLNLENEQRRVVTKR